MKNKVTLLFPYFGASFPNTFDILIKSMNYNKDVNFLIITNIKSKKLENNIGKNTKIIYMTLKDLQKKATTLLNISVNLTDPYKICDLRPFFGIIFQEYLKDSKWWGHYDPDIVLGDLNKFIKSSIFNEYDKVLTNGHLTFYKNTDFVNHLAFHDFGYKCAPTYKEVLTSKASFNFDEWGKGKRKGRGISWLIDKTSIIKQYDNKNIFADVNPIYSSFILVPSNKHIKYFVYKEGKIWGQEQNEQKHEYLYVHFQKRTLDIRGKLATDRNIYFYPNFITNTLIKNFKMTSADRALWKKRFSNREKRRKKEHWNLPTIKRRLRFMFTEF